MRIPDFKAILEESAPISPFTSAAPDGVHTLTVIVISKVMLNSFCFVALKTNKNLVSEGQNENGFPPLDIACALADSCRHE